MMIKTHYLGKWVKANQKKTPKNPKNEKEKSRKTKTVHVSTANREVRLRVALRTDPGVALSCFSPLAALPISLWLITGVEGSDEE